MRNSYYFNISHDMMEKNPIFDFALALYNPFYTSETSKEQTELLKLSRNFAFFLIKLPPQVMLKICLSPSFSRRLSISTQLTLSPCRVVYPLMMPWLNYYLLMHGER